MKVRSFDPDQRAQEKAASRQRDEEALASGRISREELQFENGGRGLFRHSVLVRKPKERPPKP